MPPWPLFCSFLRPGLCLKASLRRGTRLSLPHGRPDSAAHWIKALTLRRWRRGHSWIFPNLIKSTALYPKKSRRVSSRSPCSLNWAQTFEPFEQRCPNSCPWYKGVVLCYVYVYVRMYCLKEMSIFFHPQLAKAQWLPWQLPPAVVKWLTWTAAQQG